MNVLTKSANPRFKKVVLQTSDGHRFESATISSSINSLSREAMVELVNNNSNLKKPIKLEDVVFLELTDNILENLVPVL